MHSTKLFGMLRSIDGHDTCHQPHRQITPSDAAHHVGAIRNARIFKHLFSYSRSVFMALLKFMKDHAFYKGSCILLRQYSQTVSYRELGANQSISPASTFTSPFMSIDLRALSMIKNAGEKRDQVVRTSRTRNGTKVRPDRNKSRTRCRSSCLEQVL